MIIKYLIASFSLESTCTLSWLEGELYPWLRTLSAIATVHSMAAMRPEISPREAAVRLVIISSLISLVFIDSVTQFHSASHGVYSLLLFIKCI